MASTTRPAFLATRHAPLVTSLISSLTLTDFRSYSSARLELASGPVVLHGPNGAGKTNLLEAVSLLTPGKGLRGATAAANELLANARRGR